MPIALKTPRKEDAMTVLILGGSGMLGHQLWEVLSPRFDAFITLRRANSFFADEVNQKRVIAGVSAEDFDSIIQTFAKVQPDVVINCIGVVKQQGAAKDPIACLSINSLFPHRLMRLCQATRSRLIHVSTDCVFSGKKGNYTESDFPDADDLYGRSKLLGEVQGPRCLTLRTSIIGRELQSQQGLIEWFLSNQGKTVSGYRNAIFSGLTTQALSELIARLLLDFPNLEGLWHVAAQPINKFDLLSLVRDTFKVKIDIKPDERFHCDRSLCDARFRQATGWASRSWPEMIQAMHGKTSATRAA
jgi:dTDP-4-dehydrorhamnose reductase